MITRPHIEFVCPEAIEPRSLSAPFADEPLVGRPLVGDLAAGDGAALVELPQGWRGAAQAHWPYELIIVEGSLDVDGDPLGRYGYVSAVPGEPQPALRACEPTLVFVDALKDVTAKSVQPFSEDGFTASKMPGLTRKIVRGTEDGARGWFLRIPPGWNQQLTEWHDCAEAAFHLEGELWHVRANDGAGGTMGRLCYFWRPRYILHSPMGSETGVLSWVYVDGQLISHFVEHGEEPPVEDPAPSG